MHLALEIRFADRTGLDFTKRHLAALVRHSASTNQTNRTDDVNN